jgi:hypothetical protein
MTRCTDPAAMSGRSRTGGAAHCASCCATPGGLAEAPAGRRMLLAWSSWHPCACWSLLQCGMQIIADGALLDLLRRVRWRPGASRCAPGRARHTEACRAHLLAWVIELGRARGAFPAAGTIRRWQCRHWQPSAAMQECWTPARWSPANRPKPLALWRQASDVLAVHLLLKRPGAVTASRWRPCSKPG